MPSNYFSTPVLFSIDLHNKELCDGLPASQCYLERIVGFQLPALWNEIFAR